MAAGMSEPEAGRRAHILLGGLEQTKELCRDAVPAGRKGGVRRQAWLR
jgi:hypothetical protein